MKEYPMTEQVRERLNNTFTYHAPKEGQTERYEVLRTSARHLAEQIVYYTPVSREQSLAITKLEEAVMHANAAIARNE